MSAAAPPRGARCGRCGASYDLPTFRALAAVRVLGEGDVAPHVVRWPAGATVDVRACSSCACPIARLEHAPGQPPCEAQAREHARALGGRAAGG
jgi:hypothetical protein